MCLYQDGRVVGKRAGKSFKQHMGRLGFVEVVGFFTGLPKVDVNVLVLRGQGGKIGTERAQGIGLVEPEINLPTKPTLQFLCQPPGDADIAIIIDNGAEYPANRCGWIIFIKSHFYISAEGMEG